MQGDAGPIAFAVILYLVTGFLRGIFAPYYISFVIKFGTSQSHSKRHVTAHKVDDYNCLLTSLPCFLLWVGSVCCCLLWYLIEVLWIPVGAYRAPISHYKYRTP